MYYKKNKYNAKTQVYNGRTYHSQMEARYAQKLDWMLKAGEITNIKPQKKIELRVNDKHIANHYVDFEVTLPDGRIEWHEVKGFATDTWIMKRRLTEALYPDINYKVIRKA